MTCLEAQSYIMSFVEGKIPESKQDEFVRHMKNCKNCHDELEYYYTLIVGMNQLDNNEELSTDFKNELEVKLNKMEHKVKGKQRMRFSAFSVFLAGAILVIFLVYANCLNRVYNFEQNSKLSSQGEYYFSRELDGHLFFSDRDLVYESEINNIPDEETFYERVHLYNILFPAE